MREAFLVNPPRKKKKGGARRKHKGGRRATTGLSLKEKRRVWGRRYRARLKREGGSTYKHRGRGGARRRVMIRPRGHITITARNRPARRRYYRSNPVRRYHRRRYNAPMYNRPRYSRRYRRNAVSAGALGGPFDLMRNLPYFVTGGLSAIATVVVPTLVPAPVGSTPTTQTMIKYGVQAGVAIGGGFMIGKFMGKTHGAVWAITGGAIILADVITNFVLKPMGLLSDYEVMQGYEISPLGDEYVVEDTGDAGAFPENVELGAFPY